MKVRAAWEAHREILQAAVDGDLDLLKIKSVDELLDAYCSQGCSVLHWAAGGNQVDVLDYLLQFMDPDLAITRHRKTRGRTPLHYAARNGCIEAVRRLVSPPPCHQTGQSPQAADPNVCAKDGVTPFQLAVWRNHLPVVTYLFEECRVDLCQTNDFGCAAVHWLAISPLECAGRDGEDLLRLASWLASNGADYHVRQRQGHSALHKAAWQGHLRLCQWLHDNQQLWDDTADHAGNYAADLADMANTPRHAKVAAYLRKHCSRSRIESLAVLGLSPRISGDAQSLEQIRRAYRSIVRQVHPDRQNGSIEMFLAAQQAYNHLVLENGNGTQTNPMHSLKPMLQESTVCSNPQGELEEEDLGFFKTRLIAVVREYGDRGLDVSNVHKKWKQVWPQVPFPYILNSTEKRPPVSKWLREKAGDIVDLRLDEKGSLRVHLRT